MTAQTLGQGHVIWVSTTANDEWTDFPAHVAYMPLMQELLAHSVKSGTYWMNLEVGQELVVPPTVEDDGGSDIGRSEQETSHSGVGVGA